MSLEDEVFKRIFHHFRNYKVGIVGSAVVDYEKAHDIDVLVSSEVDFKRLAESFGAKYKGWDEGKEHIRLAQITIPGVKKPIQIVQNSGVKDFSSWPHRVRLKDGSYVNEDKLYKKGPDQANKARARAQRKNKPFSLPKDF